MPACLDGENQLACALSCGFDTGGEGAPDLTETLKNLAINAAAVAGLSFLLARDLQGSSKDRLAIQREESLSRLQVWHLSPAQCEVHPDMWWQCQAA